MGGWSHWPGMCRVPAWGELERHCGFQQGLDEEGSSFLLPLNLNHLSKGQD